jgi:hopanoid biosynthesis associated protein HpnK
MVAGPAAAHAVALAKRLPNLRVGLHLALLECAPALPPQEVPDLLDKGGNLRSNMATFAFDLLHPAVRSQLRREIDAQFAAFRKTGLALDHVSAHKHFHVHPLVAGDVLAACRAHGVSRLRVPHEPASVLTRIESSVRPQLIMAPWTAMLRERARRADFIIPDAVFGLRWSGQMTPQRLAALLKNLPDGLVEIYTHPATSDTFPGHARRYGYKQELAALTDPAVTAALLACGRSPGGYADAISVPAPPLAAAG